MIYKAISRINIDGKEVCPGDTLDVSGKQAEDLLEAGAIEPLHKPFGGYKPSIAAEATKGK